MEEEKVLEIARLRFKENTDLRDEARSLYATARGNHDLATAARCLEIASQCETLQEQMLKHYGYQLLEGGEKDEANS